jgi:filamentous hemagglutinin family protein
MMKRIVIGAIVLLVSPIVWIEGATAQVVPDFTVGTTINQSGASVGINGGTRSGNNLFHSFNQFSVPTGGAAIFNNATDVQTIFSRVTGSQLSNIDGILKTQGTANLFLMNPNGIVFGPNAQLQLGGSFLGTTASAIKFEDGMEFNTVNTTPALLSVKVPIGLQIGTRPSSIQINNSQLKVNLNQAVLLIGGDIQLSGGTVMSAGGAIGFASLQQPGLVRLQPDWSLDTAAFQRFGDIALTQGSSVQSKGVGGGNLQFLARNLDVIGYSEIASITEGDRNGGTLSIRATESLNISDVSADGSLYSVVWSRVFSDAIGNGGNVDVIAPRVIVDGGLLAAQTNGLGKAGNLTIQARSIALDRSGQISTITFGKGQGGDLTIQASDSVVIKGYLPSFEDGAFYIFSSGLFVEADRGSSGNGGNLTLTTPRLLLQDGGRVSASAYGTSTGNAGTLDISAQDVIVDGVVANELGALSGIEAAAQDGALGNAGSLRLNTTRLQLINGGQITVSNMGMGQAGNLVLNARSIDIQGMSADGLIPSRIQAISESSLPAGSIAINAERITLRNHGTISVSSVGTGDAGNLTVNANQVRLDQGSIQSESTTGTQGNLFFNLSQALLMRNGSTITTNATDSANGGNITINSPVILGLENSDIIANSIRGRGGNINITTQGIIGLEFRNTLTPRIDFTNDITASSRFSVNGNVQVNTIGINPTNALNALSVDIADPSRQIADSCAAAKTSSFIATGRGGMPQSPMKSSRTDRTWHDLRPTVVTNSVVTNSVTAQPIVTSQPLVEASAFEVDETGTIILVATKPIAPQPAATCAIGGLN